MIHSQLPDLESARRRLIDALVPEAGTRRIRWSEGSTQVLESGTGAPVLFVHGGLGQASNWLPLWPHLAEGRRWIAMDRPGHGLADPYDYRDVDVLDHAVRFLAETMDALKVQRAPIVANSMGGRWALELALRHPERVERLVFAGAPAGSIPRVPRMLPMMRWPLMRRITRRVLERSTPGGVRDFFRKLLVAHPERVHEEIFIASAAAQRRNAESLLRFLEAIVTYRAIQPELVVGDRWRRLETPVTFVWGEHDAFDLPSTGRIAARECREARLVEIAGAGHLPWLDEPAAVAAAVSEALGIEAKAA